MSDPTGGSLRQRAVADEKSLDNRSLKRNVVNDVKHKASDAKQAARHPKSMLGNWRNDCIAAVGEFLGTVLFLLLGLGGIQAAATSNSASLAAAASSAGQSDSSSGAQAINTVASVEQLIYISTAMGLSLLIAAWCFYRVTGSVFNPNVGLALAMTGILSPFRFVLYVLAETTGAIAASAILDGLLPGPLAVTPALGAGTSNAQGVWIEAFITAALCLVVMFLAVEKHATTPLAPVGIGLTLFASHLWAVVYTGAAMNWARAFGPSVVTGFSSDHWIYFVGDGIGSLIAVVIYYIFKSVNFYELNPGQDSSNVDDSPDLLAPSDLLDVVRSQSDNPETQETTESVVVTSKKDASGKQINATSSDRLHPNDSMV
ncbi:uncharacterized protein L969DRAFT_50253 [Mixia osmundae IAM 14324]|uniref:Aquaporin n=1 Tax=Mixia osmundae (strain CBS 9802 / IAM 14324 / JCM 22182 / KY 12970) TaxID=764103 RepID=G7DYY2_MIXOS|nr:uncharacterized protein L969DRAFT_50253 [Mixia osmundae IAM 14324]KEI38624.1 hypothetical protein L969DRAFT_50253 [Mixia osmundae IAM 14324]GAA95792.1 hypothetical protein E5Q_02449 [Mixia osmundae IAM 14324]